jgi:peptidoglycan/LPS O-acetylase OafA/YrhL
MASVADNRIIISRAPRLHALDGVRAVAVSLVALHHLGAFNAAIRLSETGHKIAGSLLFGVTAGGVELFFVLSGVVLARPYLRAKRPMIPSSYLLRRVYRLFPPFLVAWLVAGLSIYLAANFPTWWTQTENLPKFNLLVWLEQIGILYWGAALYNNAWWSLSTEVVFYLLFPLFIPLFRHVSESHRLAIPIFLLTVSASVFAFAHPIFSAPVFNRLIVYSSCFCAGMLLAAIDFRPMATRRLAIAGISWAICSAYVAGLNPHVGWGLLAFALVSEASDNGTALETALSKPIFVWLGERSYSIFLTHFAVIVLVFHGVSELTTSKGAAYFFATRLLSVPLILLTAMLLFHFVERRFAKNLVTANAFWPWNLSQSNKEAYAGAT